MEGYIDMHSHILPGLDDGAGNMDITRKMLQLAYKEGIRTIIATPHFIPGKTCLKENELEALVQEVNKEANKLFQEKMIIYAGNELYGYSGLTKEMREGQAHTLAGTSYVLVEFAFDESYRIMYDRFRKMIQQGYRPILAHVERFQNIIEDREHIWDLVDMGVYIQMNINSLMGGSFDLEAKKCRRLLNEGVIHFLGSDCHNITGRKPIMKTALQFLEKKKVDRKRLEQMVIHNPRKLLENVHL